MLTSCAAQGINREQLPEAEAYQERYTHSLPNAAEEPTWAELMEEMAVSSRQTSPLPGSDSQRDANHHPGQRALKGLRHPHPAKPRKTTSDMLPWWSEDQQPSAQMRPQSLEPDEQVEGTADSQGNDSRRTAAWQSYTEEVSEVDPSLVLTELQDLRQQAQELLRSEEVLRQEVTSLTQQLERAHVQADAGVLLQKKCAELQRQITGLQASAQAQEAQYSALEQEHAQVQDRLDAQLEVIAEKATQQQQDLAAALERLQAAQGAKQRLEKDKAALERHICSAELQLTSVQSELQTAQNASDQAEARCRDLSGSIEALQEELAEQKEATAGEVCYTRSQPMNPTSDPHPFHSKIKCLLRCLHVPEASHPRCFSCWLRLPRAKYINISRNREQGKVTRT